MVTRFDIGYALTNRLDNTGTLVSENDWESTFGILARQCICIYLR